MRNRTNTGTPRTSTTTNSAGTSSIGDADEGGESVSGVQLQTTFSMSTTVQYSTSSNNKPHRLFCELIMPLTEEPVYSHLPDRTTFMFTEEDILTSILSRIDKKCPQLYNDRSKFLQTVDAIVFGR